MAEPFPWASIMRFGLGELRLAPRDFWAMTLPELRAAMPQAAGPTPATQPPGRDALDELMRRFPDRDEVRHGR